MFGPVLNVQVSDNGYLLSRDTPHGLKTSGFCAVAHTDVFSLFRTSYAGMRREPYACGGCHRPNYVGDTEFSTILVPDVAGSHAISMPDETALLVGTAEDPPLG